MIGFIEDADSSSDRIRALGKRVEKIIFIGLFLAFLSSVLLLLSNAVQSTRVNELTFIIDGFRACAQDKKDELISDQEDFRKYLRSGVSSPDSAYLYSIYSCSSDIYFKLKNDDLFSYDSYNAISELLKKAPVLDYKDIDPYLMNLREKIISEPLKIQGIELSRQIEFTIFGNKIKTDFDNLLFPIKFVYTIVLLLWLLSFKRSRMMEIVAIKNHAKDITYVYPHFLNTYSTIRPDIIQVPIILGKSKPEEQNRDQPSDTEVLFRVFYTVALFMVILGPFFLTFIQPFLLDWVVSILALLFLGCICLLVSGWIELESVDDSIYFRRTLDIKNPSKYKNN